jgi:small conductance mechanosensitive channel
MSHEGDVSVYTKMIMEQWSLWASSVLFGIVLFLMFWMGGVLFERIWNRLALRTHQQLRPVFRLVGRSGKVILTLIGVLTGLGTVGVDLSAVIAGLGLTGFALGFALKDAISNFLAGALIMIYQPFKPADQVSVTGLTGTVEDINLRYTVLRNEDGKQVLIPNSLLFTNSITVHAVSSGRAGISG